MPGMYFNPLKRVFLNLSGGTVTGDTIFTQGVNVNELSGNTIFSANTNLSTIIYQIATIVATGVTAIAPYLPISGGIGGQYYFTGNTTGDTLYVNADIIPSVDNNSNLGTIVKRYRSLNIVNGIAVNFTAETKIVTPILSATTIQLGSVIVNENTIVLTGDTIDGNLDVNDWV